MRLSGLMLLAVAVAAGAAAAPRAAIAPAAPDTVDRLHRPLDAILDLYVRDGLVYYRALRSERGRLDRYAASLDVAPAAYAQWTPARQAAFWVNAYNTFVLRTVIDHYPIRTRSAEFPAGSIRQIPGAFERLRHRAAGRSVTLDEIETEILPPFADPRLYLALGRGAVGSARLRSEAFTAGRLDDQLAAASAELVRRHELVRIDRTAGRITVTPIIGWREAEFSAAYGDQAPAGFEDRSPIERAVIALIAPYLYPAERRFVERNQFSLGFHEFDWRLNDWGTAR